MLDLRFGPLEVTNWVEVGYCGFFLNSIELNKLYCDLCYFQTGYSWSIRKTFIFTFFFSAESMKMMLYIWHNNLAFLKEYFILTNTYLSRYSTHKILVYTLLFLFQNICIKHFQNNFDLFLKWTHDNFASSHSLRLDRFKETEKHNSLLLLVIFFKYDHNWIYLASGWKHIQSAKVFSKPL